MGQTVEARLIEPAEHETYARMLLEAFLTEPPPAEHEPWVRLFAESRCVGVEHDGMLVGGLGMQAHQWTVPGGRRSPVAALIAGAVATDWRRRGAMRAMMTRLFHDLHERGEEPVAAFHASSGRCTPATDARSDRDGGTSPCPPASDGATTCGSTLVWESFGRWNPQRYSTSCGRCMRR